jgi:predicted negative regulator of RcsB-dependent stress response
MSSFSARRIMKLDPRESCPGLPVRARLVATAAVLVTLLSPPVVRADGYFDEGNGVPAEWNEIANGYMSDPVTHGPELLAIANGAGGTLPPQFMVLVADAQVRAGRAAAAEATLKAALDAKPDPLWQMFATLGLGGTRMMQGDPDGAAVYFETLAATDESAGWAHAIGNLGLGHARLATDRPMDAKAAFDAAVGNEVVDDQFRFAGKFGSGMALYEAGDLKAAAEAFEELAAEDPDGPFGRDARFAAARARLEAGDRESAVSGLKAALERCDPDAEHRRTSRRLRDLDPRALSREWLRNYRTMSWQDSMARDTSMYTIGGCDLARSTLRELRPDDPQVQSVAAVIDLPDEEEDEPVAASDLSVRREAAQREPSSGGAGAERASKSESISGYSAGLRSRRVTAAAAASSLSRFPRLRARARSGTTPT